MRVPRSIRLGIAAGASLGNHLGPLERKNRVGLIRATGLGFYIVTASAGTFKSDSTSPKNGKLVFRERDSAGKPLFSDGMRVRGSLLM